MPVSTPTLLVIEDEPDQALLVSVAARHAHPGLDVRFAADGREGIAYIAGTPPFQDRAAHPSPDLIILDLIMPEVDGLEVLEWIRDQPGPMKTPVVVLTSSANAEDGRRSLELGALAVYKKPPEVYAMGRVVKEIVDRCIGKHRILSAYLDQVG